MHPVLDTGDSNRFALEADPLHGQDGLLPGMRISRNITLVQLLRTGGMGNVWLANHAGLDTQVAVKFMSKELASDPALVSRFGREAKLVARIKSPHVVQIFDYATTADGMPYIVMELLEGETLEARVQSGRALTLEEASRVLVQICKALERAHALGVIHRDIKPDNVFLIENDDEIFVKVVDFGIARDERGAPGVTVSGTTMGTPSYMSPEQLFQPKNVDLRSDLWSTAVVIYHCLTGELPFKGDNFGSVCVSINQGTFTATSDLSPEVPHGLDAWFEKALSIDKHDRFESATEMADAYLAELEKASLLPPWAAHRQTKGALARYTTDPAGISGGPITLRPSTRRRGIRAAALVLGMVPGLLMIAAALQGSGAIGLVRSRIPSGLPRLNDSTEDALVPEIDAPRVWVSSTEPAFAERDRDRSPTMAARKAVISRRFVEPDLQLLVPAPSETPHDPEPAPAPAPPSPTTIPSTLVHGI